jgi:hypothetical protein
MVLTIYAAWIGLGLGLINISWDIYKWAQRRARLRIAVQTRIYFEDDLAAARKDSAGQVLVDPWVTVTVTNVGEMATTVDRVYFHAKFRDGEVGFGYPSVQPYDGKHFPTLLKTGETVRVRIKQASLEGNAHVGPLYATVWTADRSKPLTKKVSL